MASADIQDNKIKIQINYREKPLIETLPGATFRQGGWWMPLSWISCLSLRGVFKKDLQIGPELLAWSRAEYHGRVEPALALRDKIDPPDGMQLPLLDAELRPYQQMGVAWMLAAGSGILGDEMGVGKTVQAHQFIEAHRSVWKDDPVNDALPALVIVPNSTKIHWAKLAKRWCKSANPYVVDGSAVKRRKILDAAAQDPRALVVISLEQVRTMSRLAPYGSIKLKRCRECDPKRGDDLKPAQCEVHPKELNRMVFRTVMLDEAHRIKDPKSKQTRAVWQVMHAPGVRYRWGLTGTPLASHVGDLWAPLHAVAPEDYPTKTRFVDRYCLTDWNMYGGMDIVGLKPDTKDEFFKGFDPRFRRMLKADVLDQLPPIIRDTRYCELTLAMRRTYDELYGGLATRLPDGSTMIAWNDMTKQGKLVQLASSAVELDKRDPDDILTWKVTLKNPSPKIDALVDLLDDLGVGDDEHRPPVVVAAESRQLVDLAHERLAATHLRVDKITGDTDTVTRDNLIEALGDGALDVLLFTIKAGGVGLNMQAADTLIFMQQPWSMIERLQTEGRVHRFGSEIHNAVKIIDLVTADTVEDDQIQRVYDKLEKLEEITRDRERRIAAGEETHDLDFAEGEIVKSNILQPAWPGEIDGVGTGRPEPGEVERCSVCGHPQHEIDDGRCAFSVPSWEPSGGIEMCQCRNGVIESPERPSDEIVEGHRYTDTTGVEWGHPGTREACSAPECQPTEGTPTVGTDETPVYTIEHRDTRQGDSLVKPYLVSASKLNDWSRCRRKWWLTWVRELSTGDDQFGARATGTRIHKALAGYYVPDNPVDPRDGLEEAIAEDWQKVLDKTGITEEHPDYDTIKSKWNSTCALERAMIEGYMEWLEETGADAGLQFVSSEQELSADVETVDHHGRYMLVRLMGRLDSRLIKDVNGHRLFMDHKTTDNFARIMKMIQMDPQILMYHLLEFLNTEEGEARCDGALYNMLRKVKRTAKANPPFYQREDIRVSDVQIESFKRWCLAAARDMAEAEERLAEGNDPLDVVYPTRGDDCSWKCDFYAVCPLFNDGSRVEDMISGVYQEADPWSRYDRLEGETK
jgi:superfamily II DNA or RNA helicase